MSSLARTACNPGAPEGRNERLGHRGLERSLQQARPMAPSRRPASDSALESLSLAELEAAARAGNGGRPLALREWTALAEAWRIAQALRETGGNRSAASRLLGIGRRTLYAKMDRHALTPVWLVRTDDDNESEPDARVA